MWGLDSKSSAVFLFFYCVLTVHPLPIEEDITENNETELILVHGAFRHGQRTTYRFYPNDPHKNETFYPIGLGGLTNKGKQMEFGLGKFLRETYGDFLGDIYTEDLFEIRSTNTPRTRMSALLALAGLWPPEEEQVWNSELSWLPIPVNYKDSHEDLLSPSDCSRRTLILKDLPNRPDVEEIFISPYRDIFNYVESNSGMTINDHVDLLEFYFIINTEDELGLTLPKWTEEIYPEPLYGAASRAYEYLNFDPEVRAINTGYLLNKIIIDTLKKIEGDPVAEKKKMYLYSGHETTVAYMLEAMKLNEPHIPPYASALLVEVHRRGSRYYIKLRYRRGYEKDELEDLVLPGCELLCPIEMFVELVNPLLPQVPFEEACKL